MRLPMILELAANPFNPPTFRPDYSHPLVSVPLAVAGLAVLKICTIESAITEKCSSYLQTASIASCRARLYDSSQGAIAVEQITAVAITVLGLTIAFAPSFIANTFFRPKRSGDC